MLDLQLARQEPLTAAELQVAIDVHTEGPVDIEAMGRRWNESTRA